MTTIHFTSPRHAAAFAFTLFGVSMLEAALLLSGPVRASLGYAAAIGPSPMQMSMPDMQGAGDPMGMGGMTNTMVMPGMDTGAMGATPAGMIPMAMPMGAGGADGGAGYGAMPGMGGMTNTMAMPGMDTGAMGMKGSMMMPAVSDKMGGMDAMPLSTGMEGTGYAAMPGMGGMTNTMAMPGMDTGAMGATPAGMIPMAMPMGAGGADGGAGYGAMPGMGGMNDPLMMPGMGTMPNPMSSMPMDAGMGNPMAMPAGQEMIMGAGGMDMPGMPMPTMDAAGSKQPIWAQDTSAMPGAMPTTGAGYEQMMLRGAAGPQDAGVSAGAKGMSPDIRPAAPSEWTPQADAGPTMSKEEIHQEASQIMDFLIQMVQSPKTTDSQRVRILDLMERAEELRA